MFHRLGVVHKDKSTFREGGFFDQTVNVKANMWTKGRDMVKEAEKSVDVNYEQPLSILN